MFIISCEIFEYTKINYNFIKFIKQILFHNNKNKKIWISNIAIKISAIDVFK